MESVAVLILAAGLGKRMGSQEPKVLAHAEGRSLIEHVLCTAHALQPAKIAVVVGHRGELVKETVVKGASACGYRLDNIVFAMQPEQKGTGHAVQCGLPALGDFTGTILILYGDVPLIRPDSLQRLLEVHEREQATLTLLSLKGAADNAYGRVIRDDAGNIQRIVELKDCSPAEAAIDETNAGFYAVDSAFLKPAVEGLTNDNAQGEYYLTDIVQRAAEEGQRIAASVHNDCLEFQGVNTKEDLALVQEALARRRQMSVSQ